jgi:moderate conductance mechanosensitive channel
MRVSRHLNSLAVAAMLPVGMVGTALAILLVIAVAGAVGIAPAVAQPASGGPPSAAPVPPAPEDLRALADLLDKPDIRAWLRSQPDGAAAPPSPQPSAQSASQMIGSRIDAARAALRRLAGAIPDLPAQLGIVGATLKREMDAHGAIGLLGPLVGFAILGSLAEALFKRTTKVMRERIIVHPLDTLEQRVHALAWRLSYGIAVLGVFAAGSIGAFLAFDWPPLLQEIILTYLGVVLAVRLTLIGGRFVLAPGAERFRLLPMSTVTARYWFVWSAVLVGAFYFAKGTFHLVPVLGATLDTRTLVGTVLSIALLGLTLVALWRRPGFDGSRPPHRVHEGATWLITLYLGGVWLTIFTGETAPFDIGLIALLVVLASVGLDLIVAHLLGGPPGEATDPKPRPVAVVTVHRGLRLALLAGGALAAAYILGLDLTSLAENDMVGTRLIRAGLDIVIIVLVADFVWEIGRIGIDHHLSGAARVETAGSDADIRRRQRLLTLLPVLRNVLLIAVVATASLMALSALGVNIGPLVAGAGVVGIAIGFGAQTLVKDVIAGMFFLFDDAFRVGEYIESGHVKGTVESFSLRSVKMRHHRGALHTVPFGALSTITNYSRDWVIDKMSIGVTYDTDLDSVKRIVKEIGRTLQDDPEFAPLILEPLKMQGVEQFGDFAIQVRLKMTTRPGEQFVIRRRAYELIKRSFDEHGIKFAYPTVTLAGEGSAGGPAASAAAKTALDVVQADAPRGAA